jgi:hypothetical protein
MKVSFHSFLTSALNRGEWLTSQPARFTREERPIEYKAERAPKPDWKRESLRCRPEFLFLIC